MGLTKSQIKLLESLPLGEWVSYDKLTERTSKQTIKALVSEGKILAVKTERPATITDEDVESGSVIVKVRPFADGDWWPTHIKKIDESYRTDSDNKVAVLEEKVRTLEEMVKRLTTQ